MPRLTLSLTVVCVVLLAGCTKKSGPRVEHGELGQRFLLGEEPADAQGILDYREAASGAAEVALVGRIGGGNPTWSPDAAMFLISDPSLALESHGEHECHDENCPFCKGKSGAEQAQAIAILTSNDGQVPPYDVRKLLPLEEGQMVVVRGRPEINGAGQLVVHVSGLYLRR
jgi:hypothetical protein